MHDGELWPAHLCLIASHPQKQYDAKQTLATCHKAWRTALTYPTPQTSCVQTALLEPHFAGLIITVEWDAGKHGHE